MMNILSLKGIGICSLILLHVELVLGLVNCINETRLCVVFLARESKETV
jgi:hypothetical protein